MWNFMQNFHDGLLIPPPGEENEPESTTDTELSSTEDTHPLAVQEPSQDSDICQLIEEYCVEVPEDALDSKLLLINSICQRLDKKEVVHKSSISLNNSSQISSIHSVAPIQSTKKPEHLLSMGYEHLSITPETESDAENLLPIPSKCKDNDDLDSSDDKSLPDKDVPAEEFKIYSNPLFDEEEINSDKLDPHCFNVESDFVESLLNRDTFIELNAEIADTIVESIPLLPIPVWNGDAQQEEIEIVTSSDDVLPPSVENDDDSSDDPLLGEADLFLSDNSIPPGIENFADDPEGDICFMEELLIDDSILSHELSDSNFKDNLTISRPPPEPPDAETNEEEEVDFEDISQIQDGEPDQERSINLVENDIPDNSSNDPLLEKVDLFLSDNSIPLGIENVADDPEGDIHFLEELLINDSILSHESSDSNFEDNPSNFRPPQEPPDDNFYLEPQSRRRDFCFYKQ
nr:hypothetical protein [Tanacetum cinerariifolium]